MSHEQLPTAGEMKTYLLDLVAAIRSLVDTASTVREPSSRIISPVPSRYATFFIVCDTYRDNSIKAGELQARGVSERYASPDMKVPHDFMSFLRNGENKEMLFNSIQRAIEEGRKNLF